MKKLIFFCLICISQSYAQTNLKPIIVPTGIKTIPIEITQIVYDISNSTKIGTHHDGKSCKFEHDIVFNLKGISNTSEDLVRIFKDLLVEYNYNIPNASVMLFNEVNQEEPVYYIAARIINIDINSCLYEKDKLFSSSIFQNKSTFNYSLEWQVYAPLTKKVVFKKIKDGSASDKEFILIGDSATSKDAIENSMKALLEDQEFYDLLTKKPDEFETNFDNLLVNYHLASTDTDAISLSKATNSVVTIKTNSGHGSGFIISSDGYILTNQHVVGSNKTVIVALDNGMEIEGDVIRKDQQRDVALVKIPLSKLKPLALKLNQSEIGSKVYAIGAPTSTDLQGSISSGIVSTYRKEEKTDLTILQSDTIVNGGNSGGPLINEFGEVVAITVSKIRGAEGISFFIPIDSAIEKLSINLPEK